ncbi:unnamed protein product [Alopecurus aequalis]
MPHKKYKAPRLAKAADPCKPKAPRKQRAPQSKPEGWTNSSCAAELNRRAVISGERRKRLVAQKARDAAIAAEEATREEMMKNAAAKTVAKPASSSSVRATMRPPPPIQHQVIPPQHHQLPPMHQQLAGMYLQAMWPTRSQQSVASPGYSPYMQRFSPSPEYVDSDPHSGFNPNTAFANHSAPTRGPPSNLGIDINNAYTHSPTYSGTPSPHGLHRVGLFSNSAPPQFEAEMDDMITVGSNTIAADPGIDSIIGANQNGDHYWVSVKKSYEERRMLDPEFAVCTIDHGEKAMANHWASIQQACNKWHDIQEEVRNRPQSGSNVEQRMVHMFDMYRRDNNDDEFKFLHVFTRIESCEKWKEVRLALAKTKDRVYNPDTPTEPASAGRPEDNKKAKAAKAGATAAERVQAAIEQCIADAKDQALARQQMNAEREEKANARWAALMKKSDMKIELLKTNVAAKKRMKNLAFLQANDPATMTLQVAAWYKAEYGKILNGMPTAPSADEDDGPRTTHSLRRALPSSRTSRRRAPWPSTRPLHLPRRAPLLSSTR